MLRDKSKQAYESAKTAGQTTLSFAAWRAEQKRLEDEENGVVTGAVVHSESESENVGGAVIEGAAVGDTGAVLQQVNTAIDTAQIAAAIAVTATGTSKSKMAQAIFAEALAEQTKTGVAMVRKNVIARFMTEAGLSKHGANTYYQNIRDKHGLVVKKS